MDFWNAIGDFLATLEPKDWVTAGLAVVAIVVSIWTASQTWRYHPRPVLTVDKAQLQTAVERDPHSTTTFGPRLYVTVTNRGSAPAHDVRLRVDIRGGEERTFEAGTLNAAATHRFTASFAEQKSSREGVMPRQVWWEPDRIEASRVRLRLYWRQSPVPKRVRSRRVRPALGTTGDTAHPLQREWRSDFVNPSQG